MSEREHERGEGQREKQTPQGAGSLMQDLILEVWDHDLSQRQSLNQLSHPGAQTTRFLNPRMILGILQFLCRIVMMETNPGALCLTMYLLLISLHSSTRVSSYPSGHLYELSIWNVSLAFPFPQYPIYD